MSTTEKYALNLIILTKSMNEWRRGPSAVGVDNRTAGGHDVRNEILFVCCTFFSFSFSVSFCFLFFISLILTANPL